MSSQTAPTTPKKAVAAKKPKVPRAPKKVAAAAEEPVPAPVSPSKQAAPAPAPAPEKKPRGKKSAAASASASPAKPKPKAEPVPVQAEEAAEAAEPADPEEAEMVAESLAAVASAAEATGSPDLISKIDKICERIANGDLPFKKISHELKLLKKDVNKLQKAGKKKEKGRKRNNAQLSGIQKPGKLTPEMYEFTGWDTDKEFSRVDVTKHICHYIREHQLQNPADKRLIMVDRDPKLSKALNYKEGTDPKLSYPLIQRFIKVAVTKTEPVEPAAEDNPTAD
jgi:chromatin remodeling complex protein RSC6